MDPRLEVNKRLEEVVEILSQELEAFQHETRRRENYHAIAGAFIGMLIGTVGGIVGMAATGALGAIIGKDYGPAGVMDWSGLRPSLLLPMPDGLADEEKLVIEQNQAAVSAFEAALNSAPLCTRESDRLLDMFEALNVHRI